MSIISNKLRLALFLLLCSGLGFAQGAIYINTTFAATGTSTSASSINGAVDTFMLQYYTTGGPGGVSIEIDGDPGSGVFAICGSAATTTTSGQVKCVGNYKQVRANLTTLTGGTSPTVVATLVGNSSADEPSGTAAAQIQGSGAAGVTASTINPILVACDTSNSGTVTQGQQQNVRCTTSGALVVGTGSLALVDGNGNTVNTPVTIANTQIAYEVYPTLFNGATWDRQISCPNTTPFSVASTITQIVAISASTKVRVCGVVFFPTTSTAGSVDLVYGTGSNCASGTTTLSGAVTLPASAVTSVSVPIASNGPLTTPAAQALCVRTVTSTVAGYVSWEQH